PITVRSNESLGRAIALLDRHRIHQLPVLDESGRLVGMLEEHRVRGAHRYDLGDGESLQVTEVMTFDPDWVASSATVDEAVHCLWSKRLNALPVLQAGKLVGIFTRYDVVGAFHQLTGLGVEGERIEVALPSLGEDLAYAFQALRSFDNDIVSAIVAPMRRDGAEPTLYLRLRGNKASQAEARLRDAGLVVLVPEHP
ncbi:MAG: CBS domain-containing protein, partial [Phycisphaerae bacterium]|nr:CBS domain-containing protein [Phycisphaerae bacterium]